MGFLDKSFKSASYAERCLVLGSPRLLSLRIVGAAVEGTILSVDKKYWGGEEGDSVFRWFRVLIFNSFSMSFLCSVLVGPWAHV